MEKKIIYGILFSLIMGITQSALTYADEPISEATTISENADIETTSDETEINSNNCFEDEDGTEICTTLTETELHEGTSGEAEVVCADRDEPGCSEAETLEVEEESEEEAGITESWPAIISFIALGVTALAIIIFNLLGRKRK